MYLKINGARAFNFEPSFFASVTWAPDLYNATPTLKPSDGPDMVAIYLMVTW